MAPLDVCQTEDAIQAFLEHLVDPLLPAKSSVRDNPTPSQQQSVAKQELDGVCHENNWVLPIYHLPQKDGGFHANVTVKGLEFECSCGGNVRSDPREARESAAAQMLTNLCMAKPAQ